MELWTKHWQHTGPHNDCVVKVRAFQKHFKTMWTLWWCEILYIRGRGLVQVHSLRKVSVVGVSPLKRLPSSRSRSRTAELQDSLACRIAIPEQLAIVSSPGWLPTAHTWDLLHRCSRSAWWSAETLTRVFSYKYCFYQFLNKWKFCWSKYSSRTSWPWAQEEFNSSWAQGQIMWIIW